MQLHVPPTHSSLQILYDSHPIAGPQEWRTESQLEHRIDWQSTLKHKSPQTSQHNLTPLNHQSQARDVYAAEDAHPDNTSNRRSNVGQTHFAHPGHSVRPNRTIHLGHAGAPFRTDAVSKARKVLQEAARAGYVMPLYLQPFLPDSAPPSPSSSVTSSPTLVEELSPRPDHDQDQDQPKGSLPWICVTDMDAEPPKTTWEKKLLLEYVTRDPDSTQRLASSFVHAVDVVAGAQSNANPLKHVREDTADILTEHVPKRRRSS